MRWLFVFLVSFLLYYNCCHPADPILAVRVKKLPVEKLQTQVGPIQPSPTVGAYDSIPFDTLLAEIDGHLAWDKKRNEYIDSLTEWLDRERYRTDYWRKRAFNGLELRKHVTTVPIESIPNCMYLVHEHEVWWTNDPFGSERFWQDDSGVVELDPPFQSWRRVPTP